MPSPASSQPESGTPPAAPQADRVARAREDLALVAAFRRREPGATERLSGRLEIVAGILRALNTRFGRPLDEHDLADVAQDAAAIALRKLDRFDGRCELDGWLFGICQFELRNAIRRMRRRPQTIEDVDVEVPPKEPQSEMENVADDVSRALATLSESERHVVRLKHYEGLTFDEIGERLATSPSSAKTRYYRGLVKLQQFMEPLRGDYRP